MTEIRCKSCQRTVARKDGNMLYFLGCLLTLMDCDLAIPCECGKTFQFKYRRIRKKVLQESTVSAYN